MKLYNKMRPIITFLFKLMFHPKIEGTENIPKEGSVILAGTHTHFLDSLLLISSTKRNIHFLAKQELLRGPFKTFFKNMGIIPVDRKEHKDNAMESAIKELNQNGVIGIFPEGTINREKKEPTLKFKTGVIRMKNETNAKLIPFLILGKYRVFGNSVTLIFLEEYKTKNLGVKEETENFRDYINNQLIERR